MKRRLFMQGSIAAAAVMFIQPTWLFAGIDQEFTIEQRLNPILALGKPSEGLIQLKAPEVAEDGSVVPIGFEINSPMTKEDYIKTVWLLSDKNPDPLLVTFNMTPTVGMTRFETRIRMAAAANVRVYAQDSKGNMHGAVQWVEATAGCA